MRHAAFFAIVIRRRLEQFCSCYVYINVSIRHCLPCQPLFPPNPETVYRFPYSVCRIPYALVAPPLPSLAPFPYLQLHSTSSLVPTMLLLWAFSLLVVFFFFFDLPTSVCHVADIWQHWPASGHIVLRPL